MLRWILIVAGAVLLLVIYLTGRRGRRAVADESMRPTTPVPQLDDPVPMRERTRGAAATSMTARNEYVGAADSLPSIHVDDSGFARAPSISSLDDVADRRESGVREPTIGASLTDEWSNEPDVAADVGTAGVASVATDVTAELVVDADVAESATPQMSSTPVDISVDVDAGPGAGDVAQSPVQPGADAASRPQRRSSSRKIVALRLAAGANRVPGTKLKAMFDAADLRFGKYDIYHRLTADDAALFSVASMVEPGTFDLRAMQETQFPGITLFMQLPGPLDGTKMLDDMLACARQLESGMGGILQDERGLPLTEPRAQRLRDEVADFMHLVGQD